MKIEFYYKYIGIPALVILIIFSFSMIGWSRTTAEWELTFEVVDKQTGEDVDKVKVYYFAFDRACLGGWYRDTTDSEGLVSLDLEPFADMKYIGFVFVDPEGRYKMQLLIPLEGNVRYTVQLSPNPQEERRNSSYKSKLLEEIAGIMTVIWIFPLINDEEKARSVLNELIYTIEETVNKNTSKDLHPYSESILELVAGVDIDANDWIGFSDEDREKGIVGKGEYVGPKEKVIDITKTLMGKFYVTPTDPTVSAISFIDTEGNKYNFGDHEKYNEARGLIGKEKIELREAVIGRAPVMWNVHAEARAQNNVIKKVKDIVILDE